MSSVKEKIGVGIKVTGVIASIIAYLTRNAKTPRGVKVNLAMNKLKDAIK